MSLIQITKKQWKSIDGINMYLLDEIEENALKRNIPVMQKEGILFLITQLNDIKAKHCLEIGSAIGYSAMMMVNNVEGLQVDTIELNDERYLEAKNNIETFQLKERIHLYHDDALEFNCDQLSTKEFDCLFIDAAKAQYQKFFEKYIPYLKKEGIVIVDNLDFHGMIHHIDDIKNRNTKQLVKKIKRFKNWIEQNEEFETTYYPIGDGICVIKRKVNL